MLSSLRIASQERKWVVWFAGILLFFTAIPYALGFAGQGTNWQFTGFFLAVEDGNSYIAKMRLGAAGEWLFRTPYTAFDQGRVLAFFPYMVLGKLAPGHGAHGALVILFHAFRLVSGFFMVWATYAFAARFLEDLWLRKWVTVLATAGGGMGWVLLLLGQGGWLGSLPLEFYSPETFGFLSILTLPHMAFARALLLWGLLLYLGPQRGLLAALPDVKSGIFQGVLWLGMGLMNPLMIPIGFAVVGVHIGGLFFALVVSGRGIPWEGGELLGGYFRRAAAALVVAGPLAVYTTFRFGTDPFLREWTEQNMILSPHPAHYLAAYGLVLAAAVPAIPKLLKRMPRAGWLPVMWVAIFPFLAYAPYNLQRRLPEGVWVALLILAAGGLEGLKNKNKLRIANIFGGVHLVSSLFLYAGGIGVMLGTPQTPIYRDAREVAAFEYLAKNAPFDAVVLTTFERGNALPAWAPLRVVIGHGPESVRLTELRPQVETLLSAGRLRENDVAFLAEQGVDYILARQDEIGWRSDPGPNLIKIYDSGEYLIFEVVQPLP